jgi:nitrite reductase/ring-hydroxylating ferredoxin subunit
LSAEWVTVAKASEVAPGEMAAGQAGKDDIAIYNLNGEYYATHAVCTHAFALLTDGFLDGEVVECPLHAGCFEIKTGKGLGPPIGRDIKTYQTRVEGDDVQILYDPDA